MSGTHALSMGDRGRLVIPADLRERAGLHAGQTLVLIESDRGLLLLTREQLKQLVHDDLAGLDLVGELLEDRRRQARQDDAA